LWSLFRRAAKVGRKVEREKKVWKGLGGWIGLRSSIGSISSILIKAILNKRGLIS
jgi:hypothetical protein